MQKSRKGVNTSTNRSMSFTAHPMTSAANRRFMPADSCQPRSCSAEGSGTIRMLMRGAGWPEPEGRQDRQRGIGAWRFPEWFVVQESGAGKRSDSDTGSGSRSGTRPGARSRRLVPRTALTNGRYDKKPVVATRFVRACSRGHVDDVDWYRFVHARKGLAPRPSPPGAPGVPRPPPAPSRFRATARLHPQGISARAPASKFSPTPLQSIPPAACSRADSSSAASGGSTR